MAQTDQRSAGITTSTHQINIGISGSQQNAGIRTYRSHLRGLSSSPPPLRSSKLPGEYRGLNNRTPQRQHSWVIRRQHLQVDSGNCGIIYRSRPDAHNSQNNSSQNNTDRLVHIHPRTPDLCHARSHADVDRTDRSIHTEALTGPTKAVSILIGGTTKPGLYQTANRSNSSLDSRESPRHVPVSPSLRAPHGLGITVDNCSISPVNGGLQFAIRPVSSSPSLVRQTTAPVTVGVSAGGTVVLSRITDNPTPVRQKVVSTPFVNVARVQRRNSTSTCFSPFPRIEIEPNNVSNAPALIRISSSQGRGIVVTASSGCGLQFQSGSPIIRFASSPPRGSLLRPSGSCDSLLSDRLASGVISLEPARTQAQPIHHSVVRTTVGESAPSRPVSHIVLRENTIATLNSDMPNVPPSTVSVGAAKANCSPQIHLSNSQASFVHSPMSGERGAPCTDASGNVLRVPPVTVNSSGSQKPLLPPAGRATSGDANGRHKMNAKHSQYFRVQLPCTRATSRANKGFVVTDSLKLYENQILNYCQAAQRPQSWCIDFGGLNDELTLIDDSNSGSPASTVSSYSSSSSSDASQSPSLYGKPSHKHQSQQQHSKAALSNQARVFRWPVNAEPRPVNRPKPDGDDVVTPTSTPTGNGPIALGTWSEPPSPQLPPRPSAIIRALNDAAKQVNVITPDFGRPGNGQPVAVMSTTPRRYPSEPPGQHQQYRHPVVLDGADLPSNPNGGNTGTSNFSSGFETVRPVHVAPVVTRPQPTFSSAFPDPALDSADALENDLQSTCTVSNSEDSSTVTLSSAYPVDRIPTTTPNIPNTVTTRDASSSAHLTDDNHKESGKSSLNSDSLVLAPPSPWNMSEASNTSSGDVALDNSAVEPPKLFSDENSVEDNVENNSVCEPVSSPLGRKSSHESDNIHPRSTGVVHSEPALPADRLGITVETPQSGAPLAIFTELDTFGSDPFISSPSMSPELTRVEDLESESTGALSSMAGDDNTYAFSTLDSEYLAWMRLSVRDVTGLKQNGPNLSALDLDSVDSLRRAQVHHWVDLFNSNPLGLRLNFVDDSCRLAGTLRIYINLIKPVKMSLRQTMEIMPASQLEPNTPGGGDPAGKEVPGEAQPDLPAPARLVSFFLPRGTSKVVYITSSTTAVNAIQSLLDRFHIQESARKFALYEHTLEANTIVARKLTASECPLLTLLNWVRQTGSREQFLDLLRQKRIVLQENDACDIDWKDFTAAELTNFLRILDKEEAEYKNAILYQYGMLRHQLEERLSELDRERAGATSAPLLRYSRVGCSGHPHAYPPPVASDSLDLCDSRGKSETSSTNVDSEAPSPAASV